jgi:hypothetical protein
MAVSRGGFSGEFDAGFDSRVFGNPSDDIMARLIAAIHVLLPVFAFHLSDGYFYTPSEAANDQNQQDVTTCCPCVAGGKGQRNPCKMGLVAVLPIFPTSIYQYDVSGDF